MTIQILRNTQPIASAEIDEQTVFTQKLMGEHKIVADFIVDAPLPIQLGDYIVHKTEKFYINTPAEVEKINNFTYRYVIEFEGEIYRLYSKIFMDEGQADFSYTGTPEAFLLLLLTNINSIDPGWAIEKVDAATAQTLSFSGASCRTALTQVAEAFKLEYRLVGKNIYLERSVGAETTLQFEYGRGMGLYHLQRNKIEDKGVVTRVYGFGARKNLSYDYRDGAPRLVFQERFLEQNTALYGIREGSVTLDEIFPTRTGVVSGIDAGDPQVILDSGLNFDINDFLIEGVTAKVVFESGALSGYEFEIESYRHSERRIRFIEFVEQNGYTLPNNLNYPAPGDEYTLVGIEMPQSYEDAAEARLKKRIQQYLNENSVPRVIYNLNIDEKYVRERGIELHVADLVRVLDTGLAINNQIRVSAVSYPLVNPDKVTATIADTIPYTFQEKIIAETVDNNTEIINVDRSQTELARRSAWRFKKLQSLISDPDGYFDPVNIKPGSIETLMLSVGARSQDFGLIGVTIEANAGGNVNTLKISGGQLAHYQIEIEGLGYVWEMDPETFTDLDPLKHYYVYARCSSTSLTGTWAISETPVKADEEPGHFNFNLGILYAVKDGRRDFDFTNGMTYINGDRITTGTIKSLDGLNYFDLASGKFKIGNDTSSLDFNVSKEGRLTLKGVLLSSVILADNAAIENLSVRSLRTRDEGRRLEILESGNNLILYDAQGRPVVTIDDGVDGRYTTKKKPGILATDPETGNTATLSSNGLFANGDSVQQYLPKPGSRNIQQVTGSAVGVISTPNLSSFRAKAGVLGVNKSNKDDNYGGYFEGGLLVRGGAHGLQIESAVHVNVQTTTGSTYLDENAHYVVCYNQSSISVYLPRNPKRGRIIIIRRMYHSFVKVVGDGYNVARAELELDAPVGGGVGDSARFVYDGRYWLYNEQGR